eukprot:scaffold3765_cov122-Isochrysis_galbana.AAC.4
MKGARAAPLPPIRWRLPRKALIADGQSRPNPQSCGRRRPQQSRRNRTGSSQSSLIRLRQVTASRPSISL